jgi:hypothetical protein
MNEETPWGQGYNKSTRLQCRKRPKIPTFTFYRQWSRTVYIQNWSFRRLRYEPELLRGERELYCNCIGWGHFVGLLCFSYWTCVVRMCLLKNILECFSSECKKRIVITNEQTASSIARPEVQKYHCSPTLLLGAFANLRKASISFVMSVRPSACNNSAPTGRIFMKFDFWIFFRKICQENSSFIKMTTE